MKGVFEIEERSHDEKIMRRLSEHLDAVKEKHPEWVGIFLQGSQNYKLDYEGSDVDSKLIVLPSFEDFVLNRKPYSYTHIMENDEHILSITKTGSSRTKSLPAGVVIIISSGLTPISSSAITSVF